MEVYLIPKDILNPVKIDESSSSNYEHQLSSKMCTAVYCLQRNMYLQQQELHSFTLIVKLRQGSGKDRQGMAHGAKGLKA